MTITRLQRRAILAIVCVFPFVMEAHRFYDIRGQLSQTSCSSRLSLYGEYPSAFMGCRSYMDWSRIGHEALSSAYTILLYAIFATVIYLVIRGGVRLVTRHHKA
jgi:hypothetical protein